MHFMCARGGDARWIGAGAKKKRRANKMRRRSFPRHRSLRSQIQILAGDPRHQVVLFAVAAPSRLSGSHMTPMSMR